MIVVAITPLPCVPRGAMRGLALSGPFSAYKLVFAATDRGELNTVLVMI